MLLHFLKWLKHNTDIPFQILLVEGGDLEPEFRALAPVKLLDRKVLRMQQAIRKLNKMKFLKDFMDRLSFTSMRMDFVPEQIALTYSNTATNGLILNALSYLKCPVITHVHELEYTIRHYDGIFHNFVQTFKNTDFYIAVSNAVKFNLVNNYNLPGYKIEVVYGHIPTEIRSIEKSYDLRRKVLLDLGIPEDCFIVGACGVIEWHKGPDLFIQLARLVCRLCLETLQTPAHFIWVGGETEGHRYDALFHDTINAGMSSYVHFIGRKRNPMEYFASFDVLAMVSREDSFPLVNLEVASLGKPIVCFDKAGGTPEFVERDAGIVVPYLDLQMMAEKITMLASDKSLRTMLGDRAARKVQEQYDVSITGPQLLRIINMFL